MAPKKKPTKKPKVESACGTKKPAPQTTQAEKKPGGVTKKLPPKKQVGKTPLAIKEETKKKIAKATGATEIKRRFSVVSIKLLLELSSDKSEFSLELKRGDETPTGVFLDFHIRKNANTDEIGCFAVNEKWYLFIINEKHIGKKCAAGPLPDFAVIQVASWTIFWWRTRAALDYIPEAISQGAEEVEDGDATKDSSLPPPNGKGDDTTKEPSLPPPRAQKGGDTAKEPQPPQKSVIEGADIAKEPPQPPRTWEEILHFRLAAHRVEQDAAGERHKYHKIGSVSGMTIENVLIAVATFWKPLRDKGREFAFAGQDVMDQSFQRMVAQGLWQGSGVVGGGNTFIMPLFFPPDDEDLEKGWKKNLKKKEKEEYAQGKAKEGKANAENSSSKLGHLLLAVAEKSSAESDNVNIRILDSRTNSVDPDVICRRARGLACIWLDTEVETIFNFRSVPQQKLESNACGLYVILYAWAIMLGIGPIKEGRRRRPGRGMHSEFLDYGLEIVNLALAGFMDSRTVQAFPNVYGYTQVEDPTDREDDVENAVVAVRMDSGRLDRALQQLPLPSSSTTSTCSSKSSSIISAHSTGSVDLQRAPFEVKVQQFTKLVPDATRDQANTFLEITGGDVGEAMAIFMEQI